MQRRPCTHHFPDPAYPYCRIRYTSDGQIRSCDQAANQRADEGFHHYGEIRSIPSITNTQTTISFESIINSSNRGDNDSPLAFALLKVRGSFDTILRKLKTIPNFAEAHVIPGAFDILAAFRADSSEELLKKSVEKIGSINGITASETLISYNLPEKFGRF